MAYTWFFKLLSTPGCAKKTNCFGLFEPGVADKLKDLDSIHFLRPDKLWYQLSKQGKLHCKHSSCTNYKNWASNHPELAVKLKQTKKQVAKFEEINEMVEIKGQKTLILGSIRSLFPPCKRYARTIGPHPYTCDNCYSQRKYLKAKITQMEAAVYKSIPNRCGLKGMRRDLLTGKELRESIQREHVENKALKKTVVSLQKDNQILSLEEGLIRASDQGDQDRFVMDLIYLLKNHVLQKSTVQFEILKNLVSKLRKGVNHRFSTLAIEISRLCRNQVGRTNYKLWKVRYLQCPQSCPIHNFEH